MNASWNPLDAEYVYVTTTGRTTCLAGEIEIWFVERDGLVYILAERGYQAHWVQNVIANRSVRIQSATVQIRAIGMPAWALTGCRSLAIFGQSLGTAHGGTRTEDLSATTAPFPPISDPAVFKIRMHEMAFVQ